MTGRSTEADDYKSVPMGRHSLHLDNIINKMDQQSSEVQNVMRHSVASNYSFHSKVKKEYFHVINKFSFYIA